MRLKRVPEWMVISERSLPNNLILLFFIMAKRQITQAAHFLLHLPSLHVAHMHIVTLLNLYALYKKLLCMYVYIAQRRIHLPIPLLSLLGKRTGPLHGIHAEVQSRPSLCPQ